MAPVWDLAGYPREGRMVLAPLSKLSSKFGSSPSRGPGFKVWDSMTRAPALAGMGLIRVYQLTLSGLIGRQCRHLPSCSAYTYESVERFGLWGGSWMGLARICRCHPWGTHGLDFTPTQPPPRARWWTPWRYGRWRGVLATPPVEGERASVSPPAKRFMCD